MVLPRTLESRIGGLNERLGDIVGNPVPEDSRLDDRAHKSRENKFLKIFTDTCALVREQTSNQSPHLPELVEKAQEILDDGVWYAYEASDMFDFMPSWAHNDAVGQPLIKDSEAQLPVPASALRELLQMLQVPSSSLNTKEMTPDPWKNTTRRHPKSSPLARFRPKIPALTPTAANPLAMSVYDARCEVKSTFISSPIDLHLSQSNSCLALNAMGGWKNRSPALYYYLLDGSERTVDLPTRHFIEPGLAHVAFHLTVDENRRLIFVGDERRVKSYAWAASDGEIYEDEPSPTHTLASGQNDGPMTVLPDGTLVRAGKGQIAVWKVDDLETHGDDGDEIIGEDDQGILESTWRDDPEELETSSGSPATSHVKLADQPNLLVTRWRPLVHTPSVMLSHSGSCDCFTMDLEHEGRISSRYLGHGGKIAELSVSGGDPQVFLTACSDGYARLFDFRAPLPVLTFDACGQSEFCDATVLAHPDGIPTVFTGTGRAEQIKMWDVRARAPVYELATGNNRVQSLAWDSTRNCLYAATECRYRDRMGYRHDYRRAKINTREDRQGDNEDDDSDFDGFEERSWPRNAWHDENYFGYAFDAGEHRLYHYAFKENPDISVVPEYGDARVNESSSFW
ncbi:hypothetical protein FRC08_018856 [Ceratobasidium sp. 394]|nr:hypothetical protein FRC08_018856 [Ceratobasidium sp. 394]KAG9094805.1 hypothetical protein FS749_011772 [Ceratobasidium sp. UAMH 11750]